MLKYNVLADAWCEELALLHDNVVPSVPDTEDLRRQTVAQAEYFRQIPATRVTGCLEMYLAVKKKLDTVVPTIYIITATYERPTQMPDLVRMEQTLRQVPSLLWILVEDSMHKTQHISNFLSRSRTPYVHLNIPSDQNHQLKPKAVWQRNLGLTWLRKYIATNRSSAGVFYIADDDNSYALQLFEEVKNYEYPNQLEIVIK